ncbi:DREV methyltransferase [Aphelenchoides avenae]|nr:DREV methyltransferase [Aphelenchus avenae]
MYRGQRLANMLLEKDASDDVLINENRNYWYQVNLDAIPSAEIRSTFHRSAYDNETESFLDASLSTSNSVCLQLYYSFAASVLSLALTKTSINGILNRGGMFVFSHDQLKGFLGLPDDWSPIDKAVLDLGAGDGGVTSVMGQFYNDVYATETSGVMDWRLRQRGFTTLAVDKWVSHNRRFHLISALNLLDRHFSPKQLLAELHQTASQSNCLVLLAIVLPVKQYVEFNLKENSNRADAAINVTGRTFEEQVVSLTEETFRPAGFDVVRWTKLPYLCEGDFNRASQRAYYKLDDAVFLLRPVPKLVDSNVNQYVEHRIGSSAAEGSHRLYTHDDTL